MKTFFALLPYLYSAGDIMREITLKCSFFIFLMLFSFSCAERNESTIRLENNLIQARLEIPRQDKTPVVCDTRVSIKTGEEEKILSVYRDKVGKRFVNEEMPVSKQQLLLIVGDSLVIDSLKHVRLKQERVKNDLIQKEELFAKKLIEKSVFEEIRNRYADLADIEIRIFLIQPALSSPLKSADAVTGGNPDIFAIMIKMVRVIADQPILSRIHAPVILFPVVFKQS